MVWNICRNGQKMSGNVSSGFGTIYKLFSAKRFVEISAESIFFFGACSAAGGREGPDLVRSRPGPVRPPRADAGPR